MYTSNNTLKNIPSSPRFAQARDVGRCFFNSLKINSTPINPFNIIDSISDWSYFLDDLEGQEGYSTMAIQRMQITN